MHPLLYGLALLGPMMRTAQPAGLPAVPPARQPIALPSAYPAGPAHAVGDRPNIVLVIADDLGYGDLGCYGAPLIATPALDRLAQEGAKLTSFYVHPSCSPTRAALMTGRYAQRVSIDAPFGVWSPVGLPPSEVTLAEELQQRGYRTGYFGKWHLGDSPDQLPESQGFDEWFGTPWGLLGRPDILLDEHGNTTLSSDTPSWTRQFTDRTLSFIRDSAQIGAPFFAVLAHHLPHSPATPGAMFVGQSADGREYGDGVEEIDAGVEELMAELQAQGIAEKTLVIFMSDNGPASAYGAYQQGSAAPLRGFKGSTLEGGTRVPCIVRWPASIAAGSIVDEPMFVADLLPTLLSIIDGTPPASGTYDGRDVRPALLHGMPMPPGEDAVYYVAPGGTVDAVRRGAWKLRRGELFDLATDVQELVDLSAQLPLLAGELEVLRQNVESDILANRRPAAPSLRRRPTWRGQAGLAPGQALASGDTWLETEQGSAPWVVVDNDPLLDLARVATPFGRPIVSPSMAISLPAPSADLRLERTGAEFAGSAEGAASAVVWWTIPTALDRAIVVLDIGDDMSGASITIGDLGLIGDDAAPGRFDDVRVRVGGRHSPGSATIDFDLEGADGSFTLLGLTLSADGELCAYQDGLLRGVADAGAPVAWGGDLDWALLGGKGALGGAGGPGDLPLTTDMGAGDVAGVRVWDRTLQRREMESEYARYLATPFCGSQPNSTGAAARLELFGSFLPHERRLWASVEHLPAGSVGVLVVGTVQTRHPALQGYLCVSGAVQRLRVAATGPGLDHLVMPVLEPSGTGSPWTPTPSVAWTFQFVYRDGAAGRMTNAESILFSM
ncbi:MAG: sulfatase-like hydrolase/transferase [Planctomycetota bacterium]